MLPQLGDVKPRLKADAVSMNRFITATAALVLWIATAPSANVQPEKLLRDSGSSLDTGLNDRLSPAGKVLFFSNSER